MMIKAAFLKVLTETHFKPIEIGGRCGKKRNSCMSK